MEQNLQTARQRTKEWLNGIPYEVAFWRSYYGNRKRRADLFSWSLYDKECILDNYDVAAYIRSLDHKPIIMDVGCALSYAFGNRFDGKEMPVRYIDPLAPFYNRILEKYKINRPQIEFGMIETLSSNFKEETVDFIHIRNALDHCADPVGGIIQSLNCLKTNGILYLNHFRNEACNEAYRGFHQYNITEEDGHLKIWNREKEIDITNLLSSFAETVTSVSNEGRIVAVITKKAPIPEEVFDREKTNLFISQMLMTSAEFFHSTRFTLSYQWAKVYTTVSHRFMRLLPYSWINRLKKLLSRLHK